ncbi:Bromo adjacent y domain-containing 1 protein [Araneus ventricosus]|uniref:Bromo adjacent y domain-containing 1 protein n=1 Tax=Araneus ventricosus TaxID=182803 RepID=A0A4Y2H2I7_ARAVE|nr:Bromo adjacent y domain-containing 1 protein [Araneus ventricosus]
MSGTKSSSRVASVKKDGSFRYATRFLALEKGKRNNSNKETNSSKSCDCVMKSDNWKGSKHAQNSKLPVKKSNLKCCTTKDGRKKTNTNHREKVVIVSKRSSSVSVVKSCNLRKSVSVKKVSYSTSVVLSSDEDTDSDEESEDDEEEKKECLRKKRTVVKHTTSKVKSSIQESKRTESRAAKKAKAIKLLCNKLSASNKSKDVDTSRELRPRFPYNMLQEWPTARTHRMASLNALAKVHVLYENEGRTVGENLNDADECSLIDFLNENSDMDDDDDDDHVEVKKETKPAINANVKRNDKSKLNDVDKSKISDSSKPKSGDGNKSKSNDGNKSKFSDKDKLKNGKKDKLQAKVKIQRRGKKRKAPEVEIIDTRICKRMASLNAQAILAASYLQEPKPKRVYKKSEKCDSASEFDEKEVVLESKCDIKVIKTEKEDDVTFIETKQIKRNDKHNEILRNSSKERMNKNTDPSITHKRQALENQRPETPKQKNHSEEPELTIIESNTADMVSSSRKCSVANSVVASSAATTKVDVTQYTEVTKVQINTHKDAEIKTDSKSERKIEQILSNDDVAITQMYHYQSKSTNESYCVQMQTTYKPGSRNLSPSASRPPGDGLHPFVNEPLLPSNQHYYNRNPMLPPHTYQMNPNMGPVPPAIGMDHRIPRQFGGSAFTVPHYRHPQPMQFPPNEYGYYQPAGPLIQPVQDQYTIHKPVPYHPQPNPHQPPQRPQQPSSQREGFQAFESHQSHSQKPALPSHPSTISSQQKPSTSTGSPSSENLSQSSSSPQFTRRQPGDDSRTRSLNHGSNSTSFNQPPKHVRSPVMPTLHSSQQNFRSYQTQKRVPSTFRNYNLPYEHKEDPASKHRGYDTGSSFNTSHSNASAKGASRDSHLSRNTSTQSKEALPRDPHVSHSASPMHSRNASPHSSRSGENYKNINNPDNLKERYYGFKNSSSSSNQYHSGPSSSMHHSNMSHHGSTSLSMHHPNTSSIRHPSPSSMHHSNSSSEMCNPSPYSNVCNTDPSSNMYGPLNIHHSDPPSTFMPYHNPGKDMHHRNIPEAVGYPPRPPSVIEIVEDNHRDTKTYIQLEVPKNSHREKIVVVDVEDDDIEKKQVHSKTSDKVKSSFDKPPSKTEPEKKFTPSNTDNTKKNVEVSQNKTTSNEPPVKMEKIEKISEKNTESKKVSVENIAASSKNNTPLQEKTEKAKTEPPDVMVLEVKKKKESAVVRRARLHGKQRTFRDCYNRPLAQLSKTKKSEDVSVVAEKHLTKNFQPLVSLPRLVLTKVEKPPAHGWSWEGTPCEKQVYISNDDPPLIRKCYPSMRHVEGDIICVKDCVFLRSGPRKTDLPFVAKVTALWDNPADGEMNMSLLWYYRPEHTETGKKMLQVDDEVFASKHRDTNSVACIEDKCFVLTYAEYCRYKKRCKMLEDSSIPDFSIVPLGEEYPRKNRLPPPNVFPDLVLFCRKVYDYRQKRLLKNPV